MTPESRPAFLRRRRGSRQAPEPGDFFAFEFADPSLAVIGRVIRTDARQASAHDLCLVYVYDLTAEPAAASAVLPDLVPISRQLIPPSMVSMTPWRRGEFTKVGHRPLRREEVMPGHTFRSSSGVHYDAENNRVDPTDPLVGMWSQSSAESIALRAFRALNLRTQDGLDAGALFEAHNTIP